MGVSETILAAMIGAGATIGAAVFQLVKARSQHDSRPRRGALRSLLATVALMLASAVGGFAYSEFRVADAREEIAQLRAELKGQLSTLAISTARIEELGRVERDAALVAETKVETAEAIVQLAPCMRATTEADGPAPVCDASTHQVVSLCTELAAGAEPVSVDWYSRPAEGAQEWLPHHGATQLSPEGVSIQPEPSHYAANSSRAPVCVSVSNHDAARAQLARLLVQYRPARVVVPATVALR